MLSGVRKPAVHSSSRCFRSYGGISYFSRHRGNASGKEICNTSGNPFPSCRRTLPLPMAQVPASLILGRHTRIQGKQDPNSDPLRQCKQEPETDQTSKPRGLLASYPNSPDPRRPQEPCMGLFSQSKPQNRTSQHLRCLPQILCQAKHARKVVVVALKCLQGLL